MMNMDASSPLVICLERIATALERMVCNHPTKNQAAVEEPADEMPFPWDDPRVSTRARRIRLKTFGEMASIGRWHVINDTWQLGDRSMGGVDAIMAEHGYADWMHS